MDDDIKDGGSMQPTMYVRNIKTVLKRTAARPRNCELQIERRITHVIASQHSSDTASLPECDHPPRHPPAV
ncbi:hypothetical protein EVAR_58754_1 [Eumeta japonica]|uniref:Uncharacterized protein n=1 Tax=Eumeta variegata TaxID=151549 RepID=A0A4C1ZA98_EUMVA|nr:hypothetical protein EVAR_58754_1 [Eumeta japonica]